MPEAAVPPVLVQHHPGVLTLVLNRPRVLNTLNLEMIRLLRRALEEALTEDGVRAVLITAAGDKGFSAGGDLKELAQAVQENEVFRAVQFFREEYALDLLIHHFPQAVVVLVDGITMGGGLGLAAGADIIVATERTRMAMPETRIGFFPDVGATGWLFQRCPPGYPEYLALTGYELTGAECVRLGLATHMVPSAALAPARTALENWTGGRITRSETASEFALIIDPFTVKSIPPNPAMDAWVAEHFAGKETMGEIMASLNQCSLKMRLCRDVFARLGERSPTGLALTLKLLRANEDRPLPEVLAREAAAAHFMIQHPDYLEGIRARIIDKDDQPRWQPARLEEMDHLEIDL